MKCLSKSKGEKKTPPVPALGSISKVAAAISIATKKTAKIDTIPHRNENKRGRLKSLWNAVFFLSVDIISRYCSFHRRRPLAERRGRALRWRRHVDALCAGHCAVERGKRCSFVSRACAARREDEKEEEEEEEEIASSAQSDGKKNVGRTFARRGRKQKGQPLSGLWFFLRYRRPKPK